MRYRERRVWIAVTYRPIRSFATSWSEFVYADRSHGIQLTFQNAPDVQVDTEMNRRQRDWKHAFRQDEDSRADAIRAINYRNPLLRLGMYGALRSGDPGLAADTAIVVYRLGERQ